VQEVREGMGVHGGEDGGLCREGTFSTDGLSSIIGATGLTLLGRAMGLKLL